MAAESGGTAIGEGNAVTLPNSPGYDSSFPAFSSRAKRRRAQQTMSLDKLFTKTEQTKRFVVAENMEKDKDFNDISYFKVKRALDKIDPNIPEFQLLSTGKLLIQVSNHAQGLKLLNEKNIDKASVKFAWHPFLNQSRGVISCKAYTKLPDEELKEELKSFNVTDLRRIKKKVQENGKSELIDSGSFVLTFNQPELPERLNAYYRALKVRPYIPNPMRCQKCQKYGHRDDKCKSKEPPICGACSQVKHDGPCSHPVKCANCGQSHLSWNRKCEVFKREFEIQEIRVTTKLSYPAAKKAYKEKQAKKSSYADKAAQRIPEDTTRRRPATQYPRKKPVQGERMENDSKGSFTNKETGIALKALQNTVDVELAKQNSPFVFQGQKRGTPLQIIGEEEGSSTGDYTLLGLTVPKRTNLPLQPKDDAPARSVDTEPERALNKPLQDITNRIESGTRTPQGNMR